LERGGFLENRFGWAYSNPKKEEKYHNTLPQLPVDPDEEFNWYRRRVEDRPKERYPGIDWRIRWRYMGSWVPCEIA
jgi:hypothetical protein